MSDKTITWPKKTPKTPEQLKNTREVTIESVC